MAGNPEFRHAARAVIFKGDELLIMNRQKNDRLYRTLIGGGVEFGETPEDAVLRETSEETGVVIADPRLIYNEIALSYGVIQHIFLCSYVGGDPVLHPDSEEYADTLHGENVYEPGWLPLKQIVAEQDTRPFVTQRLLEELVRDHSQGFMVSVKQWTIA